MTIVFLGHAGLPQWVPQRFGVTVFFFLSGYLITTLLRREFEEHGTISLRHFYLRRLLRIFPPMWVTILVGAVFALVGLTVGFGAFALVAMVLNVTNYYLVANLDLPYELKPLWSLAVEEHFYLLFPAAYLLLRARGISAPRQAVILVAAAVVILGWRILLQVNGASYDRLAIASDTRMDSLLWGAALAIVANPVLDRTYSIRTVPTLVVLGVAGVALLVSFRMGYEPGGYMLAMSYTVQGLAMMPVFYFAILRHNWLLFAWLDWRPVRYIGTLSYMMYLVHLLLFALFDRVAPDVHPVTRGVVVFAMTFVAAHLSYVLMERPLGHLRQQFRARSATPGELDRRRAAQPGVVPRNVR